MSSPAIVISRSESILSACIKMSRHKIGSLIVVDRKKNPVGIITEKDIINRIICTKKNIEKTSVQDAMTPDIITIEKFAKLEDAILLFKKHRIKKLVVVSNKKIAGMISVWDITIAKPELTREFIDSWIKPRW